MIVKKALQLSWLSGRQPAVARLTIGVVFGGTPHVYDKPEILRKALLKTIQAFHSSEAVVDDSQIREYVTAVGKVNRAFINLPSRPRILSLWEDKTAGNGQLETRSDDVIVPQDCRVEFLGKSTEQTLECDHADLLRFPGVYDTNFRMLLEELNYMVGVALEFSALLPPLEKPDAPLEESKPREPQKEKPQEPPVDVPTPPPPRLSERSEDMYQYWERKTQTLDWKASKVAFLDSLSGWSEANMGNHISPSRGTCLWAFEDTRIAQWSDNPATNRMFIIGTAACGKTYLLRALQEQFQVARPEDTVLSFFCSPGSERPPLWEYFTWALLEKEPWLFDEIPSRYCGKSQQLDLGSFVDIWHAFQQANPVNNIWLLVDGLEQCGDEHLENFIASYTELFARPLVLKGMSSAPRGGSRKDPSTIKIIFTCRPTPAVIDAQASTARIFLEQKTIQRDISAYVDRKLDLVLDMEESRLKKFREHIKESSLSYWPYVVNAVHEVQEALLFGAISGSEVPLLEEKALPSGLQEWYGKKVLPHVQSATSSWLARTALNILASQTDEVLLTVRQLDAAMKCLSNGEYTNEADLMVHLMVTFGEFLILRADGTMVFVHPSVTLYVGKILGLEQRHANMAFLCLTYLLQDQFARPFDFVGRGNTDAEREKWLEDAHPFYDYAGAEWAFHLKESGNLVEQLMPLVRRFVDDSRPQARTWADWRIPIEDIPGRYVPPGRFALMILLGEGCKNVLERLFPPLRHTSWYSLEKIAAWGTAFWPLRRTVEVGAEYEHTDLTAAQEWPDIKNRNGQTALMVAVLSGCIDTVRLILDHEPDLEVMSDQGETALMCSLPPLDSDTVEEYNCDILALLLNRGADPNARHGLVWTTCLHQSCVVGLVEPTRLLLHYGARIDTPDIHGVTPLQCGYKSGNVTLVQKLLDAGADPEVWWRGGITSLDQCIHDGALSMFRVFLERANVNAISRSGLAAIHVACIEPNRLTFLDLLLKRPGVDVNVPVKTFWGTTRRFEGDPLSAISMAAHRGDFSAVELLLQAGADTEPALGEDYAPLHYAAVSRSVSIVRLLLEYNARVNVVNRRRDPETPLGIAVSKQDDEIVSLLLQHGADPTVEEGHGGEALIVTALHGRNPSCSVIEKLLKSRVTPTINPTDTVKGHPMVLAARTGKTELVRLLLDQGADLQIWLEPVDGLSPIHMATMGGHKDVVELLLEREPELLNVQSERGALSRSPLHLACREAPDMVKFLLEKGALASRVSCHYEESCLLLCCGTGDYDSVEAVLKAAPEMVNRPSASGDTPLARACTQKDLRIIELLLQGGADMMHIDDSFGSSCISPVFFDRENGSVDKKLELLIKYGLDINAVITNRGFTVLGVAIENGHPKDVKWLIDHGADPSRCQRSPLQPVVWRNALHVACNSERLSQVHMILDTDWISQEVLRARDWLGSGVLPLGPARPWGVEVAQAIYWACEKEKNKTGDNDVFSELITRPCINGLTLVDWNMHPVGCTMSARRQLDDGIRHYVDELLAGPLERNTHIAVAEEAAQLLLYRGGHDREAEFLLSLALSSRGTRWDPRLKRVISFPMLTHSCNVCGLYEYVIVCICTLCMELCCNRCIDFREPEALHRHRWVEIRPNLWDWASDRVQHHLEQLSGRLGATGREGLSPIEEEPEDLTSLEASLDQNTANDELQTGLQLATLHAFNRLAIGRPLFTPYLPLNAATEAMIAPWTTLIGDQRRRVERVNLNLETSFMRLEREQSYLRMGLRRRYVDEADVGYGYIIQGIQGLYREEPAVRRDGRGGDGRGKKKMMIGTNDPDDVTNDRK